MLCCKRSARPIHKTVWHAGQEVTSRDDRQRIRKVIDNGSVHPGWCHQHVRSFEELLEAEQEHWLVFDDAARNRYMIGGAHLPFPGLGHVHDNGDRTYKYVPLT
ncbi:hypothetical protein IE4771_PD00160 (plasmid) [Rhizobium etli bv. mimosae str. IE4771]|uniref:Uncharacterized protein n=1 Tax=Rhizobium etli bv. mimosae str. IE4771 TaxID=1432050 RepID=A0A060IFF3_RHIET|nr:hypothetical protein IE4771_PD00160 [Rhizobium sp. IE4771]